MAPSGEVQERVSRSFAVFPPEVSQEDANMKNFSQMISEYATKTAYQPAMWGGAAPDAASATQLAAVLTQEWTNAVNQMLKHWSTPPTTDGCY